MSFYRTGCRHLVEIALLRSTCEHRRRQNRIAIAPEWPSTGFRIKDTTVSPPRFQHAVVLAKALQSNRITTGLFLFHPTIPRFPDVKKQIVDSQYRFEIS
jgi:hypothetical protein